MDRPAEFQVPFIRRLEAKPCGMEQLALNGLLLQSVDKIAHNRMVNRGQMDTDLMGPSRLQDSLDQGIPFISVENLIMRDCPSSRFNDGHLHAVILVSSERSVDGSLVLLDISVDKGIILPFHGVRLELLGKVGMSLVIFSDHEDTRRILVDAMHNARP